MYAAESSLSSLAATENKDRLWKGLRWIHNLFIPFTRSTACDQRCLISQIIFKISRLATNRLSSCLSDGYTKELKVRYFSKYSVQTF